LKSGKLENAPVLVVDDDRDLADVIVTYLARRGYRAVAAYSGKEALSLFKPGAFHLVLTDLKMPDIGGIALMNELKKRDKRVVVMLMTGYGSLDAAVQAIQEGAYDFISKPFKMDEIEVLIHRAAEQYALSAQLRRYRKWVLLLTASLPLWFLFGYWIVKLR
jgi:DNA-binding NtrC family response regulator